MKYLKQILVGLGIIGIFAGYMLFDYKANAANSQQFAPDLFPIVDSRFYLGTTTKAWLQVVSDEYCLTADSCITSWPTGGGGGGGSGGGWSTSSPNIISTTFLSATNALVGINSSTPWAVLTVKGIAGTTTPTFVVASSTNARLLTVASNGSTTLSSLGTGPVYSTSGSLYINGTTGTGLTVQQTSPTLITPVLGVASSTSLSVSGILWANGHFKFTTASGTALTLSNQLWITGTATTTIVGNGTDSTFGGGIVGGGDIDLSAAAGANLMLGSGGGVQFIGGSIFSEDSAGVFSLLEGSSNALLDVNSLTGSQTFTFPDLTGTFALLQGSQTFTGAKTFSATTTMATTSITSLTVSSLTSGKCVQAGTGGILTNAADACGSGGSGNSAWTILSGLIHNATSTDVVLVGTTTPTTAKLFVQGSGALDPLVVASSTGTSILQVTVSSQILACTTCRLTIPQGTAPTVSGAGDIAIDTTNGQFLYYGTVANVLSATSSKAVYIETPTASEDIILYRADVPVTITKVACSIRSTVSNVPSWTFSLPHDTSVAASTANVFSSGQTCTATTSPQSYGTFSDITLAAGEVLRATSSAVSNASSTYIQFEIKFDRQ
jgi:hypothetical protein